MYALRYVRSKYVGIIWIQSKIFELKTTIYVARRAGFEFGGGGQQQPTAANGKHYLIKKTMFTKIFWWLLEYIDGY